MPSDDRITSHRQAVKELGDAEYLAWVFIEAACFAIALLVKRWARLERRRL